MNRLIHIGLFFIWVIVGCESSSLPPESVFRGNPISGVVTHLGIGGSPYLAIDTLFVPAGQALEIEQGVELRFDNGIPLIVYGEISAIGTEAASITFTSGRFIGRDYAPDRGDWDGIWLIDADENSAFEYCRILFGAKYGHRLDIVEDEEDTDTTVVDYGGLTLVRSSPTIRRSAFVANGFHGVHCDSLSNPVIENCVFYNNAGHGIFAHASSEPRIRYNIIIENDDYGVFFAPQFGSEDSRDSSFVLWYNIVWSNFSGEYNTYAPDELRRIATRNGNLDSCDYHFNLRQSPSFKDAEVWDFKLKPSSSAIDAGPEVDDLRDPDGTRLELGIYPYEYQQGEIRRTIPNDRIGNRLTTAESPFYLSYDVVLPVGETLTIDPGVEIQVAGRFTFRVQGRIIANGEENNPVCFTSTRSEDDPVDWEPGKGDWIGMVLEADGDPGSIFRNTVVSYARWGFRLNRRDAEFDRCVIMHCDSVGIFCDDFSSPRIYDSELINNSIAGILCQFNSSPEIHRNVIRFGSGYGILATNGSSPEIIGNIIDAVATVGIRLENLCNAIIINNTIARNGYFGLFCSRNSSPDIRNNIFYRNGTEDRGGIGIVGERSSAPNIEYNCIAGHPARSVVISSDPSISATNDADLRTQIYLTFSRDQNDPQTLGRNVRIPRGAVCGTQSDNAGNSLRFITMNDALIQSDENSAIVVAEAERPGSAWNVPAETVVYLESSVLGIGAVTNVDFTDINGNPVGYILREGYTTDPLFVNVSTGDFRLTGDSPCRDNGDPDPGWLDRDGTRADMGAYGGPIGLR